MNLKKLINFVIGITFGLSLSFFSLPVEAFRNLPNRPRPPGEEQQGENFASFFIGFCIIWVVLGLILYYSGTSKDPTEAFNMSLGILTIIGFLVIFFS